MAVAFNPADSSIGSRQLMSELDYLYNMTQNGMLMSDDLRAPNRGQPFRKTVRF
jgi:hypothetical protein